MKMTMNGKDYISLNHSLGFDSKTEPKIDESYLGLLRLEIVFFSGLWIRKILYEMEMALK